MRVHLNCHSLLSWSDSLFNPKGKFLLGATKCGRRQFGDAILLVERLMALRGLVYFDDAGREK
jgi:hypothetical protein